MYDWGLLLPLLVSLKFLLTRALPETDVRIDIRECGSTLYVGMAHPAPPTNTNFQITFLLTQLLEALYEDLPVIEHQI